MCGKKFNSRRQGNWARLPPPDFDWRSFMRPNPLALALALAFVSLPISALAQESAEPAPQEEAAQNAAPEADAAAEEDSNVEWSLALTSDYVFRGVTQTNYDPALQAGLTYTFGDSGIYVGGWTSNVDFADPIGPDIEFDFLLGWNHDLNDDWNVDLSLVHYSYFGERDDYGSVDYTEVIGAASWKEMLTLTLAYAPDYSNLDYSSLYANLGGSWELGNDFSLNAGIGHTDFSDDNGSYTDWNLGISRQFGPVNLALNYYDTDIDFDEDAEHHHASDEVVFSVTLGN
jgi:uncharacterized protein (TIGR02001 family)